MKLIIDNAQESITKTVKPQGNTGRVYLPKNWIGREVQIILLENEEITTGELKGELIDEYNIDLGIEKESNDETELESLILENALSKDDFDDLEDSQIMEGINDDIKISSEKETLIRAKGKEIFGRDWV